MFPGNNELVLTAQRQNRETLIQAITASGVAKVTITYSGHGDSGDICQVEAIPEETQITLRDHKVPFFFVTYEVKAPGEFVYELKTRDQSLEDALRDFALDWVEMNHGGWENNDGGAGTVIIDVATNTFTLEHDSYYTESFRYEYSL